MTCCHLKGFAHVGNAKSQLLYYFQQRAVFTMLLVIIQTNNNKKQYMYKRHEQLCSIYGYRAFQTLLSDASTLDTSICPILSAARDRVALLNYEVILDHVSKIVWTIVDLQEKNNCDFNPCGLITTFCPYYSTPHYCQNSWQLTDKLRDQTGKMRTSQWILDNFKSSVNQHLRFIHFIFN